MVRTASQEAGGKSEVQGVSVVSLRTMFLIFFHSTTQGSIRNSIFIVGLEGLQACLQGGDTLGEEICLVTAGV